MLPAKMMIYLILADVLVWLGLARVGLEANVRYLAQSPSADSVRGNGMPAGRPIRTLAATGIKGFKT